MPRSAFFDQQVESLELHEFVRIYQVVCVAVTMAELTVYDKTLEWEIFRGSSAKWGKLSRLHARALITRIANRQGHVQRVNVNFALHEKKWLWFRGRDPAVVLWPSHLNSEYSTVRTEAPLPSSVRMFSMQITRTLINAFYYLVMFKLFQLNHLLILLMILCWHHFWLQTMKLRIRTLNILVSHTVPVT